jgi:hypothetical protein
LLEDNTVCTLMEDTVSKLGKDFMAQCRRLGVRKFVPIPVGSCRPSLMMVYPHWRYENAPPVNFMQGDLDTCVLSSLASAFHHTRIPDLVWAAKLLHDQTKKVSGDNKGHLFTAKKNSLQSGTLVSTKEDSKEL